MNEQTRKITKPDHQILLRRLLWCKNEKIQKLVTIRDRSAMAQVKQKMNMLNEENIETVTGIIIFV